MRTTLAHAKPCMLATKQWQKHCYDKRHVPADTAFGSIVLLATTSLHHHTVGTCELGGAL